MPNLQATADWHADRALEAFRKGHFQAYKRHTRIQDRLRGRLPVTVTDIGRLTRKFKVAK